MPENFARSTEEDDEGVIDHEETGEKIMTSPSFYSNVRRRGSPAAPAAVTQRKLNKENETPRLRRDGPAEESTAPRQPDYRRVNFSPTPRVPMPSSLTSKKGTQNAPTLLKQWVYDDHGEAIEIQVRDEASREKATTPLSSTASSYLQRSPSAMMAISSPPLDDSRPLMNRSNAEVELRTSGKIYEPPTQLHDLCYNAKNVDDLLDFLQSPHVRGRDLSLSAATKDKKGRIPLHVFSENHAFAGSFFAPINPDDDFLLIRQLSSHGYEQSNDYKLTKFVVEAFLSTNPDGINWRDVDGFVPFERSFVQWTRRIYSLKQTRSNRTVSSNSRRKSFTTETLHSMWASTTMTVTSAMAWAGRSLHFQPYYRDDQASEMEDGTLGEASVIDPHAPTNFPSSPVRLTSLVRCSIKLLSLILEQLEEKAAPTSNRRLRSSMPRLESLESDSFDAAMDSFRSFCQGDTAGEVSKQLVGHIAKIPNLVLTLLLIDDESDREWVRNTILFKRIAVHQCSVDPWINATLQNSDKAVARRGLDYLRYVSDIVASSKENEEAFLEAVAQLDGFIPSLLALEEREIEEAATTLIVRSVLDKMISRPFAVTVVFCDFFFLCVLMIGFRCSVNNFLLGEPPEIVLKWIYIANTGSFYFVIRELGKSITIIERTRQASIYLWSIWNIADILSTAFALTSTILIRINFSETIDFDTIDPLRAFLAITTGCLWVRALSLLKSLNIQLATFVLAILQICKDILWFLIILCALVACFAQMFYTLLLPSACATEEAFKESSLQCSQSEYYLRLYTILGNLGGFDEFTRSAFTTGFSVFLIVFFSFMVVIILLNILIAIISDSYEKCLIRSHCLFGRARVLLISELVSFQNLLRTQQCLVQHDDTESSKLCHHHLLNRGWSRGSIAFFCLSVFVIFLWLVSEVAGSFYGERYGNLMYSFLSVFVNVLVFAAIMVFLSRGAADSTESQGTERPTNSRWYNLFQRAMFRLLGTSAEKPKSFRKGEAEEWRGRINYLQEEMERVAEKSSGRVESQIACLHAAMSEPSRVEEGLLNLRAEIKAELREMERRNTDVLRQILDSLGSRQALGERANVPIPANRYNSNNR